MSYPGLCKKYGPLMPEAGIAAGTIACALAGAFNTAAAGGSIAEGVLCGGMIGVTIGVLGVWAAERAHSWMDRRLREEGAGLTEGARRVRRAQTCAYAAVVAVGLTAYTATYFLDDRSVTSFSSGLPSELTGQNHDAVRFAPAAIIAHGKLYRRLQKEGVSLDS